jgi:Ca2+-binding EF-hand superfamily protein
MTARFAECDADGDQQLDFDEFQAMLPHRVRELHRTSEIRQWFDAADTDNSGTLSISEFFTWSLGHAAEKYGATALEAAFAKSDSDHTVSC